MASTHLREGILIGYAVGFIWTLGVIHITIAMTTLSIDRIFVNGAVFGCLSMMMISRNPTSA
ncbi:predicted protein [Sclerotinia sclerotiorum 1980 UF-70]|uniref:Uncharacterized protein n=1 Tax=Sclerotinia sclerotiorum (strain ATCC 18683 / 1980 / Ss-1) TaxID=665079 RepID=A7F7W7_SCLS1|nr:predicted protein [Sclerotinia sclerotiorum 1980 UF-70]EDN98838.1 predicted protein [Sclerotinia sclerotiorum 1980 UF-70]